MHRVTEAKYAWTVFSLGLNLNLNTTSTLQPSLNLQLFEDVTEQKVLTVQKWATAVW